MPGQDSCDPRLDPADQLSLGAVATDLTVDTRGYRTLPLNLLHWHFQHDELL